FRIFVSKIIAPGAGGASDFPRTRPPVGAGRVRSGDTFDYSEGTAMRELLFLAVLAAVPAQDAPEGELGVMGGGTTPPEWIKQVVRQHADAKVLIVPQASAREDAGEGSAALWREAGAKEVRVLDLKDATTAVEAVKAAQVVWMPGGDQSRLMKALDGTGVPEAIRQRYRE